MTEGSGNPKAAGNAETLAQWRNGIRISQIAHLRSAAHYQRQHRLLGVPVTVLSAVVSTSIFAGMGNSQKETVLFGAGIISALSAVLSGVQTFLSNAELAAKHQAAGVKYGKLRRRVDEVVGGCADDKHEEILKEVRETWNKIEDESPMLAQRFVDQARKLAAKPSVNELSSAPVRGQV